jgi:membrane protein implicated in regulation of membrane protease activity
MRKNIQRIPTRIAILIVLFLAALPLALVIAMADDGAISKVAIAYVGIFVLLGILHTHIGAWLDERHVRKHPSSLRNEDIGSHAIANGDFTQVGDFSHGSVSISGEDWQARHTGSAIPSAGDKLLVVARDGLTLEVKLIEPTLE